MNRALVAAIALGLAIIGVAGAMLVRREPAPAPAATMEARGAPEARFVALDGGNFARVAPVDGTGAVADMASYRGKRLLVNLWATWCAPCIKELPSLGKLQQELGGEDFQVVTIAVQERDPAKIASFLEQHGAGDLPVLIDHDDTIRAVAEVTALPTSLLVDRDGKVKAMLTGDAAWHCGAALAAVKAFVADGSVMTDELRECE